MRFDITCSTDDNYIQHCLAMLCSVFDNNKNHEITLHLLEHNLSECNKELIRCLCERYNNILKVYEIEEGFLTNLSIADYHPDLSIATYYRLLLPSVLESSIHNVLYLDCDVIVLEDISDLFELELSDYGVAAVKDGTPGNNEHRKIMGLALNQSSFCAGVLMINLDYWRNNNSQINMVAYANKMNGKLIMEDQDILNHEFRNHWFQLPYKYGYTPMSIALLDVCQKWADVVEYVNNPCIIHFAAHVKPWLDIRIPKGQFYWKYVFLSGYNNPKCTKARPEIKKLITQAKIRYYINWYIRPFIPKFIEIIFFDVLSIVKLVGLIFHPNDFSCFKLKCWINKYL